MEVSNKPMKAMKQAKKPMNAMKALQKPMKAMTAAKKPMKAKKEAKKPMKAMKAAKKPMKAMKVATAGPVLPWVRGLHFDPDYERMGMYEVSQILPDGKEVCSMTVSSNYTLPELVATSEKDHCDEGRTWKVRAIAVVVSPE